MIAMDLVWYVSYGSNMHADRFACYVEGGIPAGGRKSCPGCRDRTPPRQAKGFEIEGGVYFATESPVWRGGRAFFDRELPTRAHVRAYLITRQQFSDVCAQEMYRIPGTDPDLDLTEVLATGRSQLGDGRYETLVRLGYHDRYPMLTFTAPWSCGDEPLVPPSGPYLRMLGHGLIDTHGWNLRQTANYLSALRGVAGVWSSDEIIPMLYPYVVVTCTSAPDGRIVTTESEHDPADLHDLAESHGVRRLEVTGDWANCTRFLAGNLADEFHLRITPEVVLRHEIQRWEVRTRADLVG
ncbi:hypothetical protein ABZ345_26720 [Lentzea sp. NPDC005914]|uniref:hypothetical protein n=1 Tax=Lentzea sp. NPDC005914 TaxID=3154572 RepID=UPI0033D97EE6